MGRLSARAPRESIRRSSEPDCLFVWAIFRRNDEDDGNSGYWPRPPPTVVLGQISLSPLYS